MLQPEHDQTNTSSAIRILIAALGSYGDMHPFLGIAQTLRQRGHHITFIAPAMYAPLTTKLGFDFVPIGTVEQFDRFAANPDLWHPLRSFAALAEGVGELNEAYFDAIRHQHVPSKTILVISSLVFGGRVAQDLLGIPTVSVHLSPAVLRSAINPPRMPPLPVSPRLPAWANRALFAALDWIAVDRLLAPPVNKLRAKVGLGPVKGIFRDWFHSPDRVIGLFPDWFAPPAPDWPKQTVLTGFPLYDEADITPIDPELEDFLNAGPPPIAFTPGSAMRHGREFFTAAIEACRLLNRRGILLSRHEEHLPEFFPDTILHVNFAPLSRVLPRCCAMVHHAGIGTLSQTLAAGIPHLATPMAHDQPDNADRLKKLGVAAVLPARRFTGNRGAAALSQILNSPAVAAACTAAKKRFENTDPLTQTAEWIERAHRPT